MRKLRKLKPRRFDERRAQLWSGTEIELRSRGKPVFFQTCDPFAEAASHGAPSISGASCLLLRDRMLGSAQRKYFSQGGSLVICFLHLWVSAQTAIVKKPRYCGVTWRQLKITVIMRAKKNQ